MYVNDASSWDWTQQSYELMCCVCICVGLTQKWTHVSSEIHKTYMMSFHHIRDLKRNWHNSRWLGLPLPHPINVPSLECPPDLAQYQWGCYSIHRLARMFIHDFLCLSQSSRCQIGVLCLLQYTKCMMFKQVFIPPCYHVWLSERQRKTVCCQQQPKLLKYQSVLVFKECIAINMHCHDFW